MAKTEHGSTSDGLDPFSAAVFDNGIRGIVSKWGSRSDLVAAVYPDKEALVASNKADEIFSDICEGKNISGINCDLIRQRENNISDVFPENLNMVANKEIEKIDKYVSKMTGVSLNRMKKASDFWVDNVMGD